MLIIHKRKKSYQDNRNKEQINTQKNENNYNTYTKNNSKHYSLAKKGSFTEDKPVNNYKYIPIQKSRIKSPQEASFNPKYSRNTFNHFHFSSIASNSSNTIKNQKTLEDNNSKRKNEVTFGRIKSSNQYNLTETNNNSKTLEIPFTKYNNIKSVNNKRNNPTTVNIKVENNNKYLIDEELSNQRYKNHQTKSTKISKLKTLQKEKSQEEFKKRLFINSAAPLKRNNNSILIENKNKNNTSNIINNVVEDKNIENKRDNYKNTSYYDSKHSKQNHSVNKRNNTTNNLMLNRRSSNSNYKDNKEKEKDLKKEYTQREIRRPIALKNNIESKDNDSDEDSEILDNLANSLSSLNLNPGDNFGQPKSPIFLSPLIFSSFHSKFKPSGYSSDNEFSKNDIIKAYAYNSSEGNIRDYNEDTITATKIVFNPKDKNNYCYFFGIYDGHGGNGCSVYLKNHLHKNIHEPTVKGLKRAILETENNFLEKVAVNSVGNLEDTSGSCGVMALIRNRKCIIANVGDSRCVLFRSKRLVFSTRDHKPNSDLERKRIESAGGSVYQAKVSLELFQNGKLVEIPWRVQPGGLSVSRTFGDIESKDIKFGGKKGVVEALPDVVEFELTDDHNFLVMGCDGIFDVLSNKEIMECIKIVLRIHQNKKKKINELCADFASMIIKSALAKESFDNVSCVVVVFNVNDII
jgi:serine/threonine protein phosphatase PrpC